jgi:murein DD-endopeptidase MepM/ murein hydrolase activator NlpD
VTQGNRGSFSHERLADRFAWDFQRVDAEGRAARGDGASRQDFAAFGTRVLAPADGVVVKAKDGVPDNLIGARNDVWPGGNCVVIRHAAGELSHLCHLKCGSLLVREGDAVRAGQPVAQCGCSGNAAEPHLHYVLRVGPTSDHDSVPARFEAARITRDGEDVPDRDGVPQAGDLVESGR